MLDDTLSSSTLVVLVPHRVLLVLSFLLFVPLSLLVVVLFLLGLCHLILVQREVGNEFLAVEARFVRSDVVRKEDLGLYGLLR